MSDIVSSGSGGLRCAWEVRAGILPGRPMPEHTKRWFITSETWELENQQWSDEEFKKRFPEGSTFLRFQELAHEYAKGLNDPRYLNWVSVEWLWY